jgi:hypothetical protein
MKYTVSFTAWYLNADRICQLIGSATLIRFAQELGSAFLGMFSLSESGELCD